MTRASRAPDLKTILIATGLILTMAMGVRHGFGFWLQPISQAQGWTRETYSLAMALQNLMWGVFGPFAGMAADRYGTMRVVLVGALLYAAGLVWMALVNAADAVRSGRRHTGRRRTGLHRIRRGQRHHRAHRAGRETLMGLRHFGRRQFSSGNS